LDAAFLAGRRLLLSATVLEPHPAMAFVRTLADGRLDRSFGHAGTLVIPTGRCEVEPTRIVPAGGLDEFVLAGVDCRPRRLIYELFRVDARGRLDGRFGRHGYRQVRATGRFEVAFAANIDHKLLVVATVQDGIRVQRLRADGRLDSSFGIGGAQTVRNRRLASLIAISGTFQLKNGHLLIAGCAQQRNAAQQRNVFVTVTNQGKSPRVSVMPRSRESPACSSFAQLPDGELAAAGRSLVRVRPNGTTERRTPAQPIPGSYAVQPTSYPHEIVVQADGRILVSSKTRDGSELERYK
jgi:hypothetical protein